MKEFDELVKTIRVLRSPGGCPWDRTRKLSDLKKYLLEETYELIEGIDENRPEIVEEELGDLFLLLIFITRIFNEKGKFSLKRVLKKINHKLITRHPHVFSSKKFKTKEEVLEYWINNKAKKKRRKTIRDRLPVAAPALLLCEVFLKERENINPSRKKKTDKLLTAIKDEVKSLKKSKAKALEGLLFYLCELAYTKKIDLESGLRNKVLKEAKKTRYPA